jgi:hypothetical protein
MTGSVSREDEITFPQVTKQITVMNRDSSNDIYVYFSASSEQQFVLPNGKSVEIDIKCTQIFVSCSTGTGFQLFAELTNIPANKMYSLDGLEGV